MYDVGLCVCLWRVGGGGGGGHVEAMCIVVNL